MKKIFYGVTILLLLISPGLSEDNGLSSEPIEIGRIGTSFKVPENWHAQNADVWYGNVEALDESNEDIKSFLESASGAMHVATFMKYDPTSYSGIIPTMNVILRSNSNTSPSTFLRYMEAVIERDSGLLNNCEIVRYPDFYVVSGKLVVRYEYQFDLFTEDLGRFRISTVGYAIPYENSFLSVTFAEESPAQNEELFRAVIQSFEIN